MKNLATICAIVVLLALSLSTVYAATSLGTVTINDHYPDPGNFTDGNMIIWITFDNGNQGYADTEGGIYPEYLVASPPATGDGQYITANPDKGHVIAYCAEISENPNSGDTTYDVIMPEGGPENPDYIKGSAPMGSLKQEYLRELWGRYSETAETTGAKAEAFSACVWEIIYEAVPATPSDWNVSNGPGFWCENVAETSTANQWLHSLDGTGDKADLRMLTHPDYQDFLVEVPEPATLSLIGLGGIGMLIRRRRSRKV